jgi:hypothetical protein
MEAPRKDGKEVRASGGSFFSYVLPAVNLVFLVVLWAVACEGWANAPALTPPGSACAPPEWSRGWITWFALPLLGTGVTLAFLALQALRPIAYNHPWIVSLPERRLIEDLPAASRRRVIASAFRRLSLFPLPATLFLLYGQSVLQELALGREAELHAAVILLFLLAAGLLAVYYLVSLSLLIRLEARDHGITPGSPRG